VSAIAALLLTAGCGGNGPSSSDTRHRDAVRVASFDFTESTVLAELYAQALESAGIPVERRLNLASREEVEPALEQGVVDVVPEYTGTALTFLDRGSRRATADAAATHTLLRSAFARRGVSVLEPAPAQDQNAVAVTRATAVRLKLGKVSDLAPVASTLVFGGPPACPHREFCLEGLRRTYGLTFRAFRPLDAAGPLTVGALEGGEVDVALLFTTTPQVDTSHFVLLRDDRGLQPADNVVPVVRTAVVRRFGSRLTSVLDGVSAELTSEELRGLDRQVDVGGRTPDAVARSWLQRHPVMHR